jgi:hypothetical protein
MTTRRAIFTACAPAYRARDPHLPLAHRKVISAIQHCPSGHDGHRRSPCPTCGAHHRVHPACGNRHCPQCQQHTPQPWLHHHLDTPLPGPHVLRTCTVPATRRPCIRSHQRLASQALLQASATALTRLATDERCIGTDRPGCTGVLHTWGRPRQYHPHIHSLVPGGGLAKDRTTWRPSRATFVVPVNALAPISRALCTEARRHAGRLEHLAPQGWTIPWTVHRQATHHGHAACTALAPSVVRVAIATPRLVSLTDRTGTCTSRTGGRARPRTTPRDALECLRRFLPHVLPDGVVHVRHCGVLHASGALPLATIRLRIVHGQPLQDTPRRIVPLPPRVAWCPTCGAPMRVVMRRWTSHRAVVDTGCEAQLGEDTRGATRLVTSHGTRASASCHQTAHDP